MNKTRGKMDTRESLQNLTAGLEADESPSRKVSLQSDRDTDDDQLSCYAENRQDHVAGNCDYIHIRLKTYVCTKCRVCEIYSHTVDIHFVHFCNVKKYYKKERI